MEFKITPEMYQKCWQFAEDCLKTNANRYAKRNQFDLEKIKKDICIGKLGELGVYQIYNQKFPQLSYPDFQIYESYQKSWDSDLKDPTFKLAVKTQSIESEIAFGSSWVFQFNNGKNYDCDKEVFKEVDPNHFVTFVTVNLPKKSGIIKATLKIEDLHKKSLFKEMKKANLRGNKVAVYYEDLLLLNEELFQK